MSDQCIPIEELEELALAEPDDERLRHLETCPRCRAELAMYRSFMAGNSAMADSGREELLATRMRKVIHCNDAEVNSSPVPSPQESGRFPRSLQRSLLAVAAVLLVFFAVEWYQVPGIQTGIHLRGAADQQDHSLVLQVKAESGALQLSWSEFPGADNYKVEILGSDLVPIDEMAVSGENHLAIKDRDMEQWRVISSSLLWRVVAFQGSQQLSYSHPRSLPEIP